MVGSSDKAQQLKRALDTLGQALEELENAMLEFEEELAGEQQNVRPESRQGLDLLSMPQVCLPGVGHG